MNYSSYYHVLSTQSKFTDTSCNIQKPTAWRLNKKAELDLSQMSFQCLR